MPRRNRVTPFSDLVAVTARGTLTGNRGVLHDENGRLTGRRWTHHAWVTCRLEFKGRRRPIMAPRRWTELFFLDEATAFAAGHRPCGECRRQDYLAFKAAWGRAHGLSGDSTEVSIAAIDRRMHTERVARMNTERVARMDGKAEFREPVDGLPAGVFVTLPDSEGAWVVSGSRLLRWSPDGYDAARPLPLGKSAVLGQTVALLTPPSVALAFAAGYAPVLHPTHERWIGEGAAGGGAASGGAAGGGAVKSLE